LWRRLQKIPWSVLFPPSLHPAPNALNGLRSFQAMQVIRTWSNSWATTCRFHEARTLACLFCCAAASDGLTHYAFCEVLGSIMTQFVGEPADASGTASLGLANPSVSNLKRTACMFHACHAVKRLASAKNTLSEEGTSDFTINDFNLHQRNIPWLI
jgi:hypothetical protein